ncbi:TPA: PH domain-containing protein [Elizabethkingia anophelis]
MENLTLTTKLKKETRSDILHVAKIHWISYVIPIVLITFGFIGLLSFAITMGVFKMISLSLTILLYKGIVGLLKLKFTKIYTTRNYLTITTGIINKTSVDISLYRVEGKKVYQSIMGRIFNYGRVYVSTGEITKSFVIANPKEFKDSISK